MEHPALNVIQIKEELSLEQIQEKIADLNKRLHFAYQMQNQSLINQLDMVLEVYVRAQSEILNEMFSGDDGKDTGQIDIS